MPEITYDIQKNYGVLSEEKSGWKKELTLVSWNGRNAKFDIRDWSPDHEKMGKGITLTREEAEKLVGFLQAAFAQEG
ncbi:conserved domain protein [Treponema primitia ZAS-2]|uniref:Conserved domain protein n=1 Tax=Treponema primitia (strain ATCC BAA-887 / DSM 12427 / ZAS-2) TaxID=545694 RepID=F5YKP3_TREPZ|nr:PC4/YdbC family ssDNA-binding protein [Treponema primitia]AEF83928.1 conserved domain protein [Treponema primitia ZAS-2]